jgi:methionine synthase II (cobalamin-independent)
MPDATPDLRFMATGIGSVPFQDVERTCREICRWAPSMPFWPQFVQRSHLEDMIIQYSEGLPLLRVNAEERSLSIPRSDTRETELVAFYERFFAEDVEAFAVSRKVAPGLYALLELMEKDDGDYGPFIKGQTVGPVTFTAGVKDANGKSILHDPELSEAMTKGLAIKALWQARTLAATGKKPVIFLDEPCLSGFGSAFSPIQRHEVVDMLRMVIDYLRERCDAMIGIHCCGNTDWSMVLETVPDIVNFDAVGYLDHFLLYKGDVTRFIERGGAIAWGVVPTANFTGEESLDGLFRRLKEGFLHVREWGLDLDEVARRSILTPACGMGTMPGAAATAAMELLSRLSERCRDWDINGLGTIYN